MNPNLKAGPGRPKGCKNKFTNLKAAFINVLEELGGEQWIKDHAKSSNGSRDFFNALVKMLPTHVKADVDGEVTTIVKVIKSGDGKNEN
jgi:hypothetical protein